jgi:hypothetical protein
MFCQSCGEKLRDSLDVIGKYGAWCLYCTYQGCYNSAPHFDATTGADLRTSCAECGTSVRARTLNALDFLCSQCRGA